MAAHHQVYDGGGGGGPAEPRGSDRLGVPPLQSGSQGGGYRKGRAVGIGIRPQWTSGTAISASLKLRCVFVPHSSGAQSPGSIGGDEACARA